MADTQIDPEIEPDIDVDAIHARYLAERDKRLRPDGNEQYIEVTGVFEHYVDDPYVPVVEREPLHDEVTVAFIGGGFAGLLTGAKLKQAGIDDVRIIEKGGDFGGTWYWNRYPGAQCDTAAFVYLPLLEETGHMPTEKYTHAPEILEHCRRIGRHFDLYDNACLSTEVTALEWDGDAARWIIRTNRGDEMRSRARSSGRSVPRRCRARSSTRSAAAIS
jgi:cyclohexanone monooxygenase